MNHHLRTRGFTIIEMMVTIAIVAILAALAGPSMADFFDRKRLSSGVESAIDILQEARSQAVKGNRFVIVTISPTAPWYIGLREVTTVPGTITACANSIGGSNPCTVNVGGTDVLKTVSESNCNGCTITSPTTAANMVFDFRGLRTSGTTQSVTFQSPKGKQVQVSVDTLGHVSACSPAAYFIPGYPSC